MDSAFEDEQNGSKQLIAFLFFFIIIAAAWQFFIRNNIEDKGIYTVATVVQTKTIKGGFLTTVQYEYLDSNYNKTVRSKYGREKKGDLYFIKILPKKTDALIFLEDYPVPECLLNVLAPDEGWQTIPSCP